MSLRELTDQEAEWVRAEGINPESVAVLFKGDYEIHLRSRKTGSDIIIYWGTKHA